VRPHGGFLVATLHVIACITRVFDAQALGT
jgi:hypothetical protein